MWYSDLPCSYTTEDPKLKLLIPDLQEFLNQYNSYKEIIELGDFYEYTPFIGDIVFFMNESFKVCLIKQDESEKFKTIFGFSVSSVILPNYTCTGFHSKRFFKYKPVQRVCI